MSLTLKNIIAVGVALVIFFIIASTLILPFFATTHEYGFGDCPYPSDTSTCTGLTNNYCSDVGTTETAVANCNNSAGYEAFLSTCGSLIATTNGTHCYNCEDWGFKTTNQGLILLVFVLALIMFAVTFIKLKKF